MLGASKLPVPTLSMPHLTVADKQGIRLKMQEMAILETLIFKHF